MKTSKCLKAFCCAFLLLGSQHSLSAEALTNETSSPFLNDPVTAELISQENLLDDAAEPQTFRPELTVNISREDFDNPLIQIETTLGLIILELFPREAPQTVANFIALAEGNKEFTDPLSGELVTRPFYDGLVFHRVMQNFMIQGGSPTGLGDGGPGYQFNDEINARSLGLDKMLVLGDKGLPHPLLGIQSQSDFQQQVLGPLYQAMQITSQADLEANIDTIDAQLRKLSVKQNYENQGYRYTETVISRTPVRGVIAMANSGPNTNGSQFFINLVDTDWLTGKHTVFGKVRAGLEVLDAIGAVRIDAQSRPLQEVTIISIRQLQD